MSNMLTRTRTIGFVAIAACGLLVAGAVTVARELRSMAAEVAALETERDDLKEQVQIYRDYSTFLKGFYLPTNEDLARHGYRIVQASNPLEAAKDKIRLIKKSAADLNDLWAQLKPMAETYDRGTEADLAIGAMLVVAAFYDYGNEPPYENLSGCAGNGQATAFKQVPELTFALHMSSDIGCCTDFAMLLGSFLDYLGYESEVMINPAHQLLRVRIDNRWDLVDPTTRIYVGDYFSDGEKVIRSFAVGGDRVYPFKTFFEKALSFEISTYAPKDWDIRSRTEQNASYGAPYLN